MLSIIQKFFFVCEQIRSLFTVCLLKTKHTLGPGKYLLPGGLSTFKWSGGLLHFRGGAHLEKGTLLYCCGGDIVLGNKIFKFFIPLYN